MNSVHIPKQQGILNLKEVDVTWDALPSDLEDFLGSDYPTFVAYYEKLPSLKILEAFRDKYKERPEVNNLLTYGYIRKRKIKKANALIEENYHLNPSHLLAKINYADLCLRRKDFATIKEIFDNKIDLRKIEPKRRLFHISEFRAYVVLMALYHLNIGEREKAEAFHYLAMRLDPNHKSTQSVGNQLFPISYRKIWKMRLKKILKL